MSLEDDILIEKFLNKTLSEKEEEAILERIKNENDFKEKVIFEKQLLETLHNEKWNYNEEESSIDEVNEYVKLFKGEKALNLKKVLKNVNEEYQATRYKKTNKNYIYVAAVIVVLIIGTIFINLNKVTTDELYVEYLQLKTLPSLVSRGNNDPNNLIKAQQEFEVKNYKSALRLFKEVEETKYQRGILQVYIGISQLELEKYSEAEKTFDTMITSDLIDASKGYWYKALISLKKKDIKRARERLQYIIDKELYHHKEAIQLLRKLD